MSSAASATHRVSTGLFAQVSTPLRQKRRGRPTKPAEERFRAKVKEDANGCWIWTGWITANGYGQFSVRHGVKEYAHRWAYLHWRGVIPDGLVIDHLCRVRACCNPAHLDVVTHAENLRRSPHFPLHRIACVNGHLYTPENTYVDSKGHRNCRTCNREKRKREPGVRVFAD